LYATIYGDSIEANILTSFKEFSFYFCVNDDSLTFFNAYISLSSIRRTLYTLEYVPSPNFYKGINERMDDIAYLKRFWVYYCENRWSVFLFKVIVNYFWFWFLKFLSVYEIIIITELLKINVLYFYCVEFLIFLLRFNFKFLKKLYFLIW